MLLNVARTAVSVVLPSKLSSDTSSTDAITRNTYRMRYVLTERMLSREMGLPSICMTLTVCGWSRRWISARAARKRIMSRETFRPPPVDPAHAPMIIKNTKITRDSSGQRLKSTVP